MDLIRLLSEMGDGRGCQGKGKRFLLEQRRPWAGHCFSSSFPVLVTLHCCHGITSSVAYFCLVFSQRERNKSVDSIPASLLRKPYTFISACTLLLWLSPFQGFSLGIRSQLVISPACPLLHPLPLHLPPLSWSQRKSACPFSQPFRIGRKSSFLLPWLDCSTGEGSQSRTPDPNPPSQPHKHGWLTGEISHPGRSKMYDFLPYSHHASLASWLDSAFVNPSSAGTDWPRALSGWVLEVPPLPL